MQNGRIYLYGLLFLLGFSACKKEETSWDSQYGAILVNDTLSLANLAKDSLFAPDVNGNARLSFNKEIYHFDLSSSLNIPDTAITQKYVVNVNSLNVQPGTSFINDDQQYNFQIGDTKLTYLHIRSGKVKLSVKNPFPSKVNYIVTLPKVKQYGVPLQRTLTANSGSQQNPSEAFAIIDANDLDINLTGINDDSYNKLQSSVNIQTASDGNTIQVTKFDTTYFSISFIDAQVDAAQGYFGQINKNQDFTQEVNFFSKLSGIVKVDDYNLTLHIKNGFKAQATVKVNQLSNKNTTTNSVVQLQHALIGQPLFLQAATGTEASHAPFVRDLNFTPTNSNLSDFIANLGSEFQGKINLQLNPNGDISAGWNEMFRDSKLSVNLQADMPINIGLSNFTFRDTLAFKLNNSLDKTHLKNAKLKLKIANAFPIDLLASVAFLNENDQIVGTVNSSDRIKASVEGTQLQNGLKYASSEIEMNISPDLAEKLSTVKSIIIVLKTNTLLSSPTTAPQMTTIPYNAFISVKVFGNFGVNFKL